MKFKMIFFFLFICLFFYGQTVLCGDASSELQKTPESSQESLKEIIKSIQQRYATSGFSARFFQTSTIKAMEITDRASGEALFKRPDKMRWVYEKPDRQTIITDGNTLWIFRPEDNQVMIGKAPSFFEGGKGFSFLSDMKLIKKIFSIYFERKTAAGNVILKLLPREKTYDVSEIYLTILSSTFEIVRVATYNSYGDKTQIEFKNIRFERELDDSMFTFKIPQGVEVLHLEE